MTGTAHELRPRTADSEKITINLGYVDLGQIDLLVQEGFSSARDASGRPVLEQAAWSGALHVARRMTPLPARAVLQSRSRLIQPRRRKSTPAHS